MCRGETHLGCFHTISKVSCSGKPIEYLIPKKLSRFHLWVLLGFRSAGSRQNRFMMGRAEGAHLWFLRPASQLICLRGSIMNFNLSLKRRSVNCEQYWQFHCSLSTHIKKNRDWEESNWAEAETGSSHVATDYGLFFQNCEKTIVQGGVSNFF